MRIFGVDFNTPQLPSQPPKSLCNSLNDCTILDSEVIKIIKQLIEQGKMDINEKNKFQITPEPPPLSPLIPCKSLNNCTILDNEAINIIKQLIKEGKDINEKNQFGKTPLMLAIEKHNIGLVKLLLIAGADPNIKDKSGYTAFCKAIFSQGYEQNLNLLKLLIIYKANVNAQTNSGSTPLMISLIDPKIDVVNLLLEAGADPNIKDNDGNNALMTFEKYNKNNKTLPVKTYQEIKNILNAAQTSFNNKTGGSKRVKRKKVKSKKVKSKRIKSKKVKSKRVKK
jgi:ankyrin repeat protein